MKNPNIYSLAMEALTELVPEINAAGADVGTVLPSLTEALTDLAPLPREALFFGIAEDGLPILLNLHDPIPGPLLVCADAGAGKTAFLQLAAQAMIEMHSPEDVQFGVLTGHPEEWRNFERAEHCAGIFAIHEQAAMDFVRSLGEWAHTNRSRQSVVFLLDDLSRIENADDDVKDTLRWLLLRGPSRHVWPIVALDPSDGERFLPWLDFFRTRIFGRTTDAAWAEAAARSARGGLDSLVAGSQFAMLEGSRWLKFWLPRLEEGGSSR
ncbi:MAG: hypothetical protein M5U11_07270 [Anaerolineales bacterium]|jgi:hypothetical protein|nr:hypothetical protein [Anaerolineales bacterium]MCC7512460.1 hypothetical protein [Anaerolineae bacterium]MBW7920305.1 hypothetical protein [Anaerolineales bacterium]MCZ2289175.1 hypothetical protein [Anaerolineales bacterium]MCZ7548932.1 hypothetical protein [Anaerolineales bacterium]